MPRIVLFVLCLLFCLTVVSTKSFRKRRLVLLDSSQPQPEAHRRSQQRLTVRSQLEEEGPSANESQPSLTSVVSGKAPSHADSQLINSKSSSSFSKLKQLESNDLEPESDVSVDRSDNSDIEYDNDEDDDEFPADTHYWPTTDRASVINSSNETEDPWHSGDDWDGIDDPEH